jgi:undecaprenyl-diphosphatase
MSGKVSWKHYGLVGGVLLTLGMFVLAGVYDSFPGDEPALVWFQGLQIGWLDTAALALDTIGGEPWAIVLIALAVVGLLILRRPAQALILVLSLGPLLISQELKELVGRPRPDYLLIGPESESLSFPSGHATYAMIFGGLLIYFAGDLVRSRLPRRWLQGCLAALILAMGASRVYLGVHWPSDVIGGFLFGGLALVGLIALRHLLSDSKIATLKRKISPW